MSEDAAPGEVADGPRTDSAELEDWRWLVGAEAAEVLVELASDEGSLLGQAARLRKRFSPSRVHLLLEQVELRRRAQKKFSAADTMFFTRKGLEQATDQWVARYKASRFPAGEPVADLCCGVGGDLIALAARGPATGLDRDPILAALALANGRATAAGVDIAADPLNVVVGDAEDFSLTDFAACHIDPDRRPAQRRSTRVADHQPGLPVLQRLLRQSGDAAIKLAPAADAPESWRAEAELEWISRDRQCRQQVAWFGRLSRREGQRAATVLLGGAVATVIGDPSQRAEVASSIGRYLYEPDPAVIAARLVGEAAVQHDLLALSHEVSYLTGDRRLSHAALAAFEVREVLPYQPKRIKALLRAREIGRLEVKKRGAADGEPERLQREWAAQGEEQATLFITKFAGRATAILASRLPVGRVGDP